MTTTSLPWKDNLHKLVRFCMGWDNDAKIPNGIIDAIDAAYVAGLDAKRQAEFTELEKAVEGLNRNKADDQFREGFNECKQWALELIRERRGM